MARVTQKQLQAKVEQVARLTGRDVHLYGAYGGWDVHEPSGEHGGATSLMGGCHPARECALFLSGMIAAARICNERE